MAAHRFATSVDAAATGATLGLGVWFACDVVALPFLTGHGAAWTLAGVRAALGNLPAWMIVAALATVVRAAVGRRFPSRRGARAARAAAPARVLILGGGFAGITTAMALERALRDESGVELTVVSDTSALVFTPMLAEVAGGSVEAAHISSPTRTALRRTNFVRGRVRGVDFERCTVAVDDGQRPYDHLVFALGAVSNYVGLVNVERHAFEFRSLLDAINLRNRVVEVFERADAAESAAERTALLTFVVAGGGFAGTELAGALNDFARGIVVDYPRVEPANVNVVLVHARERILPELAESLAQYALARMTARGVTFRLGARVADATDDRVVLDSGETIATHTIIWTAGNAPNPLLQACGVRCDRRGAAIVDATLAVADRPRVWALGDCAAVSDPQTGTPYPPTAQFALREAKTVARNIRASLRGAPSAPFAFRSLGALCVIGHQTACAEVRLPLTGRTVRFSGFLAWLAWRAIYLSKLPGFERKLRVFIDWNIELFFPRDIVQTATTQV